MAAPGRSGSLNWGPRLVDQTTMTTPAVSHPTATTVEEFRRLLDQRAVQPVFQPLIDLDSRHVIGYEALARGPLGSQLEWPAALFGAAYRAGRVAELDWACRAAAFAEAVRCGLEPPLTLFVNAEPVSLSVACPDDLRPAIEQAEGRLRVVVEVTERAVAGDPARLLATVARAREAGWGVALDDVGAAPASLAVLPFVRPDAIKLDMRLLQGRTTAEAAHIVNAVRAQAERTDAVVIAEGIETIKHAREAVAAGATIGQGFLFGHPAPLPSPLPPAGDPLPLRPAPPAAAAPTPFEVVAAARPPRRVPRELVAEMSIQLEHQGLDAAEPNVLLACFQEADRFTPATRSRFEFLATRAAFTGALGHGMPASPVAGVRGADLDADDPLRREWALVVIGPRFAAALAARQADEPQAGGQDRFDVVVSHDRDLVIAAAEPLLRRLVPER
jgi:EAL domain-containing protein (putative c-di-GMP-specific phosphodiesterase class I)